jgi:hypothetical protein
MQYDDLVSVYTVKNPTEAEVIRVALEGQGIACHLAGEGQAGLTGIIDIDVMVRAADEDRARAILESYERKHV